MVNDILMEMLTYNALDSRRINHAIKVHAYSNVIDEKKKISEKDIKVYAEAKRIHLIDARDGELFTKHVSIEASIENKIVKSSVNEDVLKIVVVNRYRQAPRSVSPSMPLPA